MKIQDTVKINILIKFQILLDEKIWSDIKENINPNKKINFNYEVENTSRSVGTRLSHYIYKTFGNNKLPDDTS